MTKRPATLTELDFIPDEGLAKIEELAARVPQDFTLGVQAYPKSVVLTLRFTTVADVFERGRQAEDLAEAAMCIDTLAKNLKGEREARRALVESLRLLHRRSVNEDGRVYCGECSCWGRSAMLYRDWPCATARLVEGIEEE